MIFTLLAALYGAAQEDFVVIEGADANYFIPNQTGSDYAWDIFTDFDPETEAGIDDYEFLSTPDKNEVKIQWKRPGTFYVSVTETDFSGCTNRKVLPVQVVQNNQTIVFVDFSSSVCFNTSGNGFKLPLNILGNNNEPIDAEQYPVEVNFTVNGTNYQQSILFEKQEIYIEDSYLSNLNSSQNSSVDVIIKSATDKNALEIFTNSEKNQHIRTIHAIPTVDFFFADEVVDETSFGSYAVGLSNGEAQNAIYKWSVDPSEGTEANLKSIEENEAEIFWNGQPGIYNLNVLVVDGNGCYSDTLSKQVKVNELVTFDVDAGPDTVVGSCNSYIFEQVSPVYESYSYSWKPALYLDDPQSPNPMFTPGETTTYELMVTSPQGIVEKDTVTITVAEIHAEAGEDLFMELGSTVLLNGTESIGSGLQYLWTTNTGKFESGTDSPNPVVSDFGTYYLEITDKYNCKSIDSVSVYRLAHAPVAVNDYDTTNYMTEVIIPVLDNDSDIQNALDSATLSIASSPLNGTAYVDYEDFTIHYRPEKGFMGSDNFEYQVCNTFDICGKAYVYVLVSGFEFMVPDAFSPNDDGINDVFEIVGIEHYEGNSLTIINRSGVKVFEAMNYGISSSPMYWDGTANTGNRIGDEELTTGTYFYILDLGIGEKPISGSIYLDR